MLCALLWILGFSQKGAKFAKVEGACLGFVLVVLLDSRPRKRRGIENENDSDLWGGKECGEGAELVALVELRLLQKFAKVEGRCI